MTRVAPLTSTLRQPPAFPTLASKHTFFGALVQAKFADLLACPAQNVMVFFADLLGLTDVYNAPGTVGAHNWSLRVAPDFEPAYEERLQRARALDLPRALVLALRARGLEGSHAGLVAALQAQARVKD